MTRIFKPSWSNAPQETPISVGQEHRASTRAFRVPKGSTADESLTDEAGLLANPPVQTSYTGKNLSVATVPESLSVTATA